MGLRLAKADLFCDSQAVSDMGKALERTSLPQSDRQALVRTLRECAGPANAVHQLLSKRVRGLWGRIMRDGRVPTDVNLVKAAGALVPRVEKVGPRSARCPWVWLLTPNAGRALFLSSWHSLRAGDSDGEY